MSALRYILSIIFLVSIVKSQNCTFKIGTFGPTGDFLYTYAHSQSYFPSNFVVCFVPILNSTDQYIRLKAGEFQVISGFADNVIGKTMAVLSVRDSNLCLLSGGDLGPRQHLSANVNNGIDYIGDLQGKDILVDSADTGAVVVLYKMLHDEEITDNTFTPAGGSSRTGRLANGTYNGKPTYATMTFFPTSDKAFRPANLINIAAAKDHFWPYQSGAYGSNCDWAKNNEDTLVTYFTGIAKAYYWFATNRAAAITWLESANPNWPSGFAAKYYDYYFRELDGLATSYSLIPHRAALCKDVVTRQAIEGYNSTYFPMYHPLNSTEISSGWVYAKDTNNPNEPISGANKYNGPTYLKALKKAIEKVSSLLNVPSDFAWEHPTSRCKNLCDINVRKGDTFTCVLGDD